MRATWCSRPTGVRGLHHHEESAAGSHRSRGEVTATLLNHSPHWPHSIRVSDPASVQYCTSSEKCRLTICISACSILTRCFAQVWNLGNWTVLSNTRAGEVCRYARIMYNSSQSKTGGVVLKCKACAHSEGVNEFDDRQGSRRTQAAQAMMNHTRNGHRKEPVGSPVSKDLAGC